MKDMLAVLIKIQRQVHGHDQPLFRQPGTLGLNPGDIALSAIQADNLASPSAKVRRRPLPRRRSWIPSRSASRHPRVRVEPAALPLEW
jgi:hypothetical protein